jgi:hypothetical protein
MPPSHHQLNESPKNHEHACNTGQRTRTCSPRGKNKELTDLDVLVKKIGLRPNSTVYS